MLIYADFREINDIKMPDRLLTGVICILLRAVPAVIVNIPAAASCDRPDMLKKSEYVFLGVLKHPSVYVAYRVHDQMRMIERGYPAVFLGHMLLVDTPYNLVP